MKTLIDIGCNKLQGYRKLVDMLGIDDTWQKIFVEPNPENAEYLLGEIENIPNSIYIQKAVTAEGLPTKLITRADREGDIGATVMGKEHLDNTLSKFDQQAEGYNEFEVEGITLWKILELVEGDEIYIKMDCEGAEYGILYNFPFFIADLVKELFVEFHTDHDTTALRTKFEQFGITIKEWE